MVSSGNIKNTTNAKTRLPVGPPALRFQPKSAAIRRVREKKIYFVYRFPGSEILRTRGIPYARLYQVGLGLFGTFLGLIFFALLEAGGAAENAYGPDLEELLGESATSERLENRRAFKREMLTAVEQVEHLVENQKEIRRLLATRDDRELNFDLEFLETSLASLEIVRVRAGSETAFGPGAYLNRRLGVHRELLASGGEFVGSYHQMFAVVPHRWPLLRDELQVNSPFGWRKRPFFPWARDLGFHGGIDLDARTGDPVVAAAAGRVRRVTLGGTGYGNSVQIEHTDEFETMYAHLQRVDVRGGDFIRAGQVIGRAGSTGYSTGPHLHYEVRRRGRPVDPAEFLAL